MENQIRWWQDKFKLYWLDEAQSIFVVSYENSYSWTDYYGMMDIVAGMIEGIAYPIVYLNIVKDHVQIPRENPMPHHQNMKRMFNPPFMAFAIMNQSIADYVRIYTTAGGLEEGEHFSISADTNDAIEIARIQVKRLREQSANDRA